MKRIFKNKKTQNKGGLFAFIIPELVTDDGENAYTSINTR